MFRDICEVSLKVFKDKTSFFLRVCLVCVHVHMLSSNIYKIGGI